MKKTSQISIPEIIQKINSANDGYFEILIQSEVEMGVLLDLLNKTLAKNDCEFKACQEISIFSGTNRSIFTKNQRVVVSDQETIKKYITKGKRNQNTSIIFLASESFWKDQADYDGKLFELSNIVQILDVEKLMLATNLFTQRKVEATLEIIKTSLLKKNVTISDVLKLINLVQLISERDFELVIPNLKLILSQEDLFFTLPRLLLTNKREFLILWHKTKQLFPIYFWTIFWGNFFTKVFVFKTCPELYSQTNAPWLKSIANISSSRQFLVLTQAKSASLVKKFFNIDWLVKNSSNTAQLESIFLSI